MRWQSRYCYDGDKLLNARITAVLVVLGLVALAHAERFQVSVRPIWIGGGGSNLPCPLKIEIYNPGENSVGSVNVPCNELTIRYPVELPRGTRKVVTVYPTEVSYGGTIALETTDGYQKVEYDSLYIWRNKPVSGVITDNLGEMESLRQKRAASDYDDPDKIVYCKPEEAPIRLSGYQNIDVLYLSAGADRMPDAAASAIENYVMLGGTLVLVGGASMPIHADARFSRLRPIANMRPKVIGNAGEIISGTTGPITVQFGDVHSAAISTRPNLCQSISYGLGRVIQLTFNPFNPPFVGYKRGRTMITNLLSQSNPVAKAPIQQSTESARFATGPYSSTRISRAFSRVKADPFSVEMPEAQSILIILAAFFVVVVPINLLILKKLKRAELAWVTAPIISVAFAFYILNYSKWLYGSGLSRSIDGTITMQQGAPTACFQGNAQIFFPNGGSYSPKMPPIENLSYPQEDDDYRRYNRGRKSSSQFMIEDRGKITIPTISVGNLSFEELNFQQYLDSSKLLSAELTKDQKSLKVTNLSDTDFTEGQLCLHGAWTTMSNLRPGQSTLVSFSTMTTDKKEEWTSDSRLNAYIFGEFTSLKVGPQVGAPVAGRSHVRLIYAIFPPKWAKR